VQNRFKLTSVAATLALGCCATTSQDAYADSGAGVGPLLNFGAETFPDPAPLVARSSSGRFAVSWVVQDTAVHRVARIYNADGTPASTVFQISAGRAGNAALAMDKDGDLIAAWYQPGTNSPNGYTGAIHAQRYTPAGTAQGREINVAPAADGPILLLPTPLPPLFHPQVAPIHVAVDDDGDFAIAWTQGHTFILPKRPMSEWDWQSSKTTIKIYNSKGHLLKSKTVDTAPVKKFFLGPDATDSDQNMDRLDGLAMNGKGDMVLVYTSFRISQPTQILAQRLDLKLTQAPTLMPLDGTGTRFGGVGIDSFGNFALGTIHADGIDTFTVGRYSASGALLGLPNTLTDVNIAGATTLSENANGDYVATWNPFIAPVQDSNGNSQGYQEKHAQYFHNDGSTNGPEIVIDNGQSQSNSWDFYVAGDASNNLAVLWSARMSDGSVALLGRLVTAP
jgi:hypothetical protein